MPLLIAACFGVVFVVVDGGVCGVGAGAVVDAADFGAGAGVDVVANGTVLVEFVALMVLVVVLTVLVLVVLVVLVMIAIICCVLWSLLWLLSLLWRWWMVVSMLVILMPYSNACRHLRVAHPPPPLEQRTTCTPTTVQRYDRSPR